MKPSYQDVRVLVVDDSPVSRKLLEHTLDVAPYSLVFVSGAVHHGYPVWVVLADLDSHKPATDLSGREAGDAMLRVFGEIIKKNTRVSDMCGHMGGDQFTFVTSHVSLQNMDLVVTPLARQDLQL